TLLPDVGVTALSRATKARHVYHLYVVRVPDRDALQRALRERGIGTGIHYPTPIHLPPAYADLGHHPGDFPHAERAASEVLSLPLYPEMPPSACDEVVQAIHQARRPTRVAPPLADVRGLAVP